MATIFVPIHDIWYLVLTTLKCSEYLDVPAHTRSVARAFASQIHNVKKNDKRKNIRFHHTCEGGIEISVARIAVWHHEACRFRPNGDCEGQN